MWLLEAHMFGAVRKSKCFDLIDPTEIIICHSNANKLALCMILYRVLPLHVVGQPELSYILVRTHGALTLFCFYFHISLSSMSIKTPSIKLSDSN